MFAKRILAALLLLLICTFSLMAYQLSPLNVTYDPTGAGSAKVYTIVNDSDAPIAIEVRAEQRIVDIDGNEANQDGSAYFSIQPNRMIIRPDSTQLVRVQYRGPQTVTRELSFRIISEQIPMPRGAQEEESGQMISFLFVYSTSAYVRPSRIVESVTSSVNTTSDNKLEIILENTGSVHQMLNDLSITLTGDEDNYYKTRSAFSCYRNICSNKLRLYLFNLNRLIKRFYLSGKRRRVWFGVSLLLSCRL